MTWIRARGKVVAFAAVVGLLLAATAVWISHDDPLPEFKVEERFVEVPAAPGSAERVSLDTSLYLPEKTPAPSVLLAHGFGGDKHSTEQDARELAAAGFVVQTYSARGFGRSTGKIGLNDPDLEVADARFLVSRLATRPEVMLDEQDDPRVAVSGASYGGGLSLLLAGTDPRVDALVPVITYNSLAEGLLPNGVFKSAWGGFLYSMGVDSKVSTSDSVAPASVSEELASVCGRFTAEICEAWTEVATTGQMSPKTEALLKRVSPLSVTGNVKQPTLLVQGEQDTLFWLGQAEATARQVKGPVQQVWFAGGHDGAYPDDELRARIISWIKHQLLGSGTNPFAALEYDVQGNITPEGTASTRTVRASGPAQSHELSLEGNTQTIITPPGGLPAAISGMPALNARIAQTPWLSSLFGMELPGQQATFTSAPLTSQLLVAGSPKVTLRVSAVGPPGDGVLFVKVFDKNPNDNRTLPGNAVTPIRVSLPADGSPVDVEVPLAGIVKPFESGHQLQVVVGTTDQNFRTPTTPAQYEVALVGSVSVPTIPGMPAESALPWGQLLGVLGIVVIALVLGFVRHRRSAETDASLADTPLVITDLTKSYPGGLKAVDGLSFQVSRGQILGLLGPNGAGKTTTLRMLMGLITPSSGDIKVFGESVSPGSPVLSRVGSFVESAGFLPHLSGSENLRLYWAATGRPLEDAHFDEALEIAGLGTAVSRRVKTYSQGMRQRLAIAQAMLGLPDLLVLDEPANGLDPPQIHAMRDVLRRYAATGRTVVVSSHLLTEVEQTCSHVVVVHRGTVIAAGTVAEIASAGGAASFTVDQPQLAAEVLGTSDVDGSVVHADLGDMPISEAVATLVHAGVSVERAGPRVRLEDAFLQLVGEGS